MELHNGYKFKLDDGERFTYTGLKEPYLQVVKPAGSPVMVVLGETNLAPLLQSITVDGAAVEHGAMVEMLNDRRHCKIVLTIEAELMEIKQVKP